VAQVAVEMVNYIHHRQHLQQALRTQVQVVVAQFLTRQALAQAVLELSS
jgi:hypothetical protein